MSFLLIQSLIIFQTEDKREKDIFDTLSSIVSDCDIAQINVLQGMFPGTVYRFNLKKFQSM